MLVYDDVPYRARPAAAPARRRSDERGPKVLSVQGVFTLMRRRMSWILGTALLCMLAAFLAGKSLTPRYKAEAQLYIDPRELRVVDKELTPVGQDSTSYLTIVESQAQVITSSNVLSRVVVDLGLDKDPEFAGGPGLYASFAASVGLPVSQAADDPEAKATSVLQALASRIAVRRTGRTFIVDVEATSRDAEKAAKIANAVVDSYLTEEASNRTEAANRASAGLSSRLAELRDAVNAAESRVQAYKVANGLIGTRDTLVTDQQLTQLNSQLAAARVRAADAQARVDQVQRMQAAGVDIGATEDALASQAIVSLRTQYAELTRKQAELSHDLGPRHPLVASIGSQVQQSRRLIDQEIGRVVQAAKTDLARAQATVVSLEQSFDKAKGKTVGMAEASIRLRELDREVEASRAVYQAFLVRSRETAEQARLDVGNARVITAAVKPVNRAYPPPPRTLAMLGFLAGLLLGVAAAIGDDWLKRSGQPAAEESEHVFFEETRTAPRPHVAEEVEPEAAPVTVTLEAIAYARRRTGNSLAVVGHGRSITPLLGAAR